MSKKRSQKGTGNAEASLTAGNNVTVTEENRKTRRKAEKRVANLEKSQPKPKVCRKNVKAASGEEGLVDSTSTRVVSAKVRSTAKSLGKRKSKESGNVQSTEESITNSDEVPRKLKSPGGKRARQQSIKSRAPETGKKKPVDSEVNVPVAGCSKFADDVSVSSEDSEEEWVDVDDATPEDDSIGKMSTSHDIEVTIDNGKQLETEESKAARYLRLEVNRRIRERRLKCHKAHLLCYIGHLKFWVRGLVRSEVLKPLCLSLIPSGYVTAALHCFDTSLAERFLNWLTSVFVSSKDTYSITEASQSAKFDRLEKLINDKTYEDDRDFALITFLFFLALDQSVRLVMSCQPLRFKVNIDHLINPKSKMNLASADGKLRCSLDKKSGKGIGRNTKTSQKKKNIKKQEEKDLKKSVALERNYWIEFWDETIERWICIDPWTKTVDQPMAIEKIATAPVHYVIAMDNEFGVRDVTARYASRFLYGEVRNLRVDQTWWDATVKLFRSKRRSRNRLEDVEIHDYLMSQPMPKNIADFKNHPLYVLKKDLLKFEAIYPPDQSPVGKIHNVDVYPRSSVYHLEGSLNWIKKARSIKPGERPYKVVKARPDIRIPKEERPTDKTLDLYGYWQTEPYVPPKVINGRIPRNEHGNLYLYKKSMLPEGCAYIQLDGIYGIARRLNVECVPCVVGWEFHKNGNHPIIDGCAVLKKDEAELRRVWSEEFEKKAIKARQRCKERAKRNWRRLFRGVILMKRVKEKFSSSDKRLMNVDEQFEASGSGEKAEDPTLYSWPRAEFNLPLTEKIDDDDNDE